MPVKFKLVKSVDDYDDLSLKYSSSFKAVGVFEIIFGLMVIIFEMITFAMDSERYYVYLTEPALWCGLVFCVTGCLALSSWKGLTKCNVIAGVMLALVSILNCIFWLSWYEIVTMRYFAHRPDASLLLGIHIMIFLCGVGHFAACMVHFIYAVKALRDMT